MQIHFTSLVQWLPPFERDVITNNNWWKRNDNKAKLHKRAFLVGNV